MVDNAAASKCDNEEIYITIDRLSYAVNHRQMVKFQYRRRCVDKHAIKRPILIKQ
ncbi:MAG: hypothetical protein LUG95_08120 [Clostridiales bacterium]|nr:hypothetical protein [Clostridiales bacterium]